MAGESVEIAVQILDIDLLVDYALGSIYQNRNPSSVSNRNQVFNRVDHP